MRKKIQPITLFASLTIKTCSGVFRNIVQGIYIPQYIAELINWAKTRYSANK